LPCHCGKPRPPAAAGSPSPRPRLPRAACQDLAAVAELGETYREFWKSPADNRPPGGESFVDQIARARAGLASLPPGDALLVVHSGTIRALLAIALDLAPDSALRFVIDPLSLTRIDRLANGWRVVAVNQR
jgi:alpha-ribazole phosphatase